METIGNDTVTAYCCVYSIVTAPAQQHAPKPSVYKGSPKKIQKRTRGLKDLRFFAKAILLSN